jgi:phosphoglycerate dehydrogenase-like enzyme
MTRIAVTSRSFSRHSVLRAELLEKYPETTFNDAGVSLAGSDLIAFLSGHEKAITALETLDAATFDALKDLRVVSKYGVGHNMIDLDAMAARELKLGWTGGVNKRSVSELAIALAISLLRHLPRANEEVRNGSFRQIKGREISAQTVGIIGCGHVGKDLAVLLRAFGCRVLAHDILDFPDFYRENAIEAASLNDVLENADIVTLHLPLDATTTNILDKARLAQMKPDALLINTARGSLVDESALKEALLNNRLSAAAFDVFAVEPPEDEELLRLPNFFATPHIGGSSEEAILAMGRAAIKGLDENQTPKKGVFPEGY